MNVILLNFEMVENEMWDHREYSHDLESMSQQFHYFELID